MRSIKKIKKKKTNEKMQNEWKIGKERANNVQKKNNTQNKKENTLDWGVPRSFCPIFIVHNTFHGIIQ